MRAIPRGVRGGIQGRALHPGEEKGWEMTWLLKCMKPFSKLKPTLRLQIPCSLPVPFGTGETGGANTQRVTSTGEWSSAGTLHPHPSCSSESWQRGWLCFGPGWSWGHARVFPCGLSVFQEGKELLCFTFSPGGLLLCPSPEHQALFYVL